MSKDSQEVPSLEESVPGIAAELAVARRDWRRAHSKHPEFGAEGFPSRGSLAKMVEALCGALFPLRLGPDFVRPHNENIFVEQTLQTVLARLYGQIRLELIYSMVGAAPSAIDALASRIIHRFAVELPALRRLLDTDLEAALAGDPAARSVDEVLICYPSMLAIIHHRLAHKLHIEGAPLVARIIAEVAHDTTGIDIHPGAQIGEAFFVDHGTGVVVGETAIVGRRVRLYQGVTLGSHGFEQGADGAVRRDLRRHPFVGDDVVIYAGATILGRVTIGKGSIIGGNVWLTGDVPERSHVLQARERIDPARGARANGGGYAAEGGSLPSASGPLP